MEDKYKIINESLNEYCKQIDDTFYMYNLDFFFSITLEVLKILEKYDIVFSSESIKIFDMLNPDYEKKTIYLSGVDSVEIVRSYLKENIPQYIFQFENCLSNGVFRFVDQAEETNERSYSDLQNDRAEINIALNHNYSDPSVIIHEFFHYLNRGTEEKPTVTRSLFTEGVSIFFETELYNYMLKLGYDEKEIYKARRFRINDCYAACGLLLSEISLIDSYLKFGDINDETFDNRQKYNLFGWTDKEDVLVTIQKLLKGNKSYQFRYDVSIGYIFGTLIAYYGVNSDRENILDNFIELNNKLPGIGIFESLDIIGLDIVDRETDYMLFNSFIKEVKLINKKYQGNELIKKYK